MDMIEAFQPDMYQSLCDGETNPTSSKKRVQKSISRSISFLEKCLERHEKSEVKLLFTSHTKVSPGHKQHVINAYRGSEIKLHAFWTSFAIQPFYLSTH
jgi:queuine/archaeosine tRNA-ribosyltransferase